MKVMRLSFRMCHLLELFPTKRRVKAANQFLSSRAFVRAPTHTNGFKDVFVWYPQKLEKRMQLHSFGSKTHQPNCVTMTWNCFASERPTVYSAPWTAAVAPRPDQHSWGFDSQHAVALKHGKFPTTTRCWVSNLSRNASWLVTWMRKYIILNGWFCVWWSS